VVFVTVPPTLNGSILLGINPIANTQMIVAFKKLTAFEK
jgi:hypothetical protein